MIPPSTQWFFRNNILHNFGWTSIYNICCTSDNINPKIIWQIIFLQHTRHFHNVHFFSATPFFWGVYLVNWLWILCSIAKPKEVIWDLFSTSVSLEYFDVASTYFPTSAFYWQKYSNAWLFCLKMSTHVFCIVIYRCKNIIAPTNWCCLHCST